MVPGSCAAHCGPSCRLASAVRLDNRGIQGSRFYVGIRGLEMPVDSAGTPLVSNPVTANDNIVSTDQAFSMLKLTTAEIVEFLKSPLVQGDHRRAFLDLLECRYGRRFGNPWVFAVLVAERQGYHQ